MRYALTPRARVDLDGIWDHSALEWGIERAETYVLDFKVAFERLTTHPRLGKSIGAIKPGYRALPVNKHLVFLQDCRRADRHHPHPA